eukprot:8038761-Heterocapsa_arctica.AAC.1
MERQQFTLVLPPEGRAISIVACRFSSVLVMPPNAYGRVGRPVRSLRGKPTKIRGSRPTRSGGSRPTRPPPNPRTGFTHIICF